MTVSAAACCVAGAAAQTGPEGEGNGFDVGPNGSDFGPFRAYPEFLAGYEFDDNARATNIETETSSVLIVRPSVRLESQWARNALGFSASANWREVLDFDDQSTFDLRLGGTGRLDIARAWELEAIANYNQLDERRSAVTDGTGAISVSPIDFDQINGGLALGRAFNGFSLEGRILAQSFDFDDTVTSAGSVIDQDFRDHEELSASLRGDWELTPAASAFAELSFADLDFDTIGTGEQDRSGERTGAVVGVDFDFTRLIRGEASIGYQNREFDNSVASVDPRDEQDTFRLRSEIEWFATPIIKVNFGASRELEETGLQSSSLNLRTRGFANVEYELKRNIILNTEIALSNEEFGEFGLLDDGSAFDRDDDVFEFSLRGVYRVNRYVGLEAGYSRFSRDVSASSADAVTQGRFTEGEVTDNTFGANLVVRY